MANIATVRAAKHTAPLGFDCVGTTLHGYTHETRGKNLADEDFRSLHKGISEWEYGLIVQLERDGTPGYRVINFRNEDE